MCCETQGIFFLKAQDEGIQSFLPLMGKWKMSEEKTEVKSKTRILFKEKLNLHDEKA